MYSLIWIAPLELHHFNCSTLFELNGVIVPMKLCDRETVPQCLRISVDHLMSDPTGGALFFYTSFLSDYSGCVNLVATDLTITQAARQN